MAKKSHSKKSLRSIQRVASAQRYRPRSVLVSPVSMSPLSTLSLIEDRRTYNPAGPLMRPIGVLHRSSRRQVAKQNPAFNQPSYTKAIVTFSDPKKVPVCVRRGVRKEVLHAKGVAGSKNLRKPRRGPTSTIRC